MKTIVPSIYGDFRCLAGACRHTCCAGWEIGIDPDTRARYAAVSGELGRRLAECIDDAPDGATFRLGPGDRCPFLNASGLCDLICALGEDSLCQICADHPRYRNFFMDRIEMGLGLCCEAAAALVLRHEPPMTWVTLCDDGVEEIADDVECEVLTYRDELITLMQDRSQSMLARLRRLCETVRITQPAWDPAGWAEIFRPLERLDPAWDEALLWLPGASWPENQELLLEQWAVYLLHRHFPGGLEDGRYQARIRFCVLGTLMVGALASVMAPLEAARMWSAEIEYDDENMEALLDLLDEPN